MESKQWAPGRWTQNGTRLRLKRVYKHALKDMELFVGPYRATLIFAELMARVKGEQSRVMLNQLGLKTIGDKALKA